MGSSSKIMERVAPWLLFPFLMLFGMPSAMAAPIQNSATGTVFNSPLNLTDATVNLNTVGGNPATSALSEIFPQTILMGSLGNVFIYDVLPTINVLDSGVDQVQITAPAGYGNLTVTNVTVGGIPQTASCPSPGAGEYSVTISGQNISVILGSKLTTSLTNIQVTFTGDAPATAGSGDFLALLGDTSSGGPTLSGSAGDADGDPGDANSYSVQVLGQAVSSVLAEVSPTAVTLNSVGASFSFNVLPTMQAGDSGFDQVTITAPAGMNNLSVSNVSVGGLAPTLSCPTPGPSQYCSTVSGQDITLTLGDRVTSSLTPVLINFTADMSSVPGSGTISGTIDDTLTSASPPQALSPGNADGDSSDQNSLTVYFTQGVVLDLRKSVNKEEAVVGDVLTYLVELRNPSPTDVIQVRMEDFIPPNFSYRRGSTLINGLVGNDPTGNKPLIFNLGTIPAFSDGNGNSLVDPGEPGYVSISYQLIVNSGASPKDYLNRAVATDVCSQCLLSNVGEAKVRVTLDPLFDLGTIIGKVFEDKNQDGWQDRGEFGLKGVMIALDDGTYALTDEFGRYHFPAVFPGQRLIKINLQSLPARTISTTRETKVVTVTPGLLAKANFGVSTSGIVEESIGKPGEMGFLIQETEREQTPEILGNINILNILVNGQEIALPVAHVEMGMENLEEVVNLDGSHLDEPVEFKLKIDRDHPLVSWRLMIMDKSGEVIRTIEGEGEPSSVIRWDGKTDQEEMILGGDIYQYQMGFEFLDGSRLTTERRMFGVNKTSAIAINLTGGAFRHNSHELNSEAVKVLKQLADTIRKHSNEKIYIEGHADSKGSDAYNLELSQRRANAALEYLVQTEKIPEDRFVVRAYGESQPIANNETEEGRELNRRVEIKGQVYEVEKSKLYDQFRKSQPLVRINQSKVPLDSLGRFSQSVPDSEKEHFEIEMVNSQGRSISTKVPLPNLEIIAPTGEVFVPYPSDRNLDLGPLVAISEIGESSKPNLTYQFIGRTDPKNVVELNGQPLRLNDEGFFAANLNLSVGKNQFGLLILNPAGFSRIADLTVNLIDQDEEGNPILVLDPIPNLTVQLPPKGVPLKSNLLTLRGKTDPENTLQINGREIRPRPGGEFSTTLTLPEGKSVVQIDVRDPDGNTGRIEREIELSKNRLFFLAFVDGEFGELRAKGNLSEAGVESDREFYQEGRLAYYLKGVVAGKYLITSAFDSGRKEFNQLFKDLNQVENDRFLTNLDPDKFYPVYGDNSTLVYDAESQGKFYLAVNSDEFHLLVGNYPVNLNETELAAYQRTLYGGRLEYQSASQTQFGKPHTKMTLFGAEVHESHIRDELRATGGSLYYLSHRDIIEGSEQITLVVRDKNTGLVLYRVSQQQNLDYTIKYGEGRILFTRPISSIVEQGSLFDQNLLSGHSVFIQVDYEAPLDSFEKTASGGRVRQQIGDHLAVGGTFVKDELDLGEYELKGVDVELQLSQNTRMTLEGAETSGSDSQTFSSEDGGLTYQENTATGSQEGQAWKVGVEVDLGEWFQSPDRFRVGGYMKKLEQGFLSSGNFLEQGTTKSGIHMYLKLTDRDKVRGRVDHQDINSASPSAATGIGDIQEATLQWEHDHGRWGFTGEYYGRKTQDTLGAALDDSHYGTGRFRFTLTENLKTHIEHQQTLSGSKNDQTTLGVDYQILSSLTLTASGTHGTLGSGAQGGIEYQIGESRLYLRERLSDDQAGRATSTVLGGETAMGSNSRVYSEYQWEKREGDDRTLSVLGAQREWDLGQGFTFILSGEHSDIKASSGNVSRYTIASGLHYRHPKGLSAKTRNELRREKGSFNRIQFLTVNRFELKLNPDFTLLGKYKYSVTRDVDLKREEAELDERSVGLAYRPVRHDRFNALARYTWMKDQGPASLPGTSVLKTRVEVASIEWSLALNRYLEWVEKEAIKVKKEEGGGRAPVKTHTYLSIHRLNLHLWKGIALGNEYRMLRQQEADDLRKGWLSELTWEVVKNLRLGVGYNFTDFSDNEFSDNDFSVYGWFIRVQGTF